MVNVLERENESKIVQRCEAKIVIGGNLVATSHELFSDLIRQREIDFKLNEFLYICCLGLRAESR